MRTKAARRRVEVNLEELDRIIDHAMCAPLSESDGKKIKAALHAMADRLTPKRSTEKTSAVLAQARAAACCASRR
jgi:Flp pilus assembly protein TadB